MIKKSLLSGVAVVVSGLWFLHDYAPSRRRHRSSGRITQRDERRAWDSCLQCGVTS